ncbi:hypothetical protein COOONC_22094 [Cooperia oncophora]
MRRVNFGIAEADKKGAVSVTRWECALQLKIGDKYAKKNGSSFWQSHAQVVCTLMKFELWKWRKRNLVSLLMYTASCR